MQKPLPIWLVVGVPIGFLLIFLLALAIGDRENAIVTSLAGITVSCYCYVRRLAVLNNNFRIRAEKDDALLRRYLEHFGRLPDEQERIRTARKRLDQEYSNPTTGEG